MVVGGRSRNQLRHKCYIAATCDRDLKRRIPKIPGVPIMYITQHKYSIERLPEATIGGGRIKLLCFLHPPTYYSRYMTHCI
ncbi:hypothetical protein AAC387_Pa12g1821 [Persea americana]